jgi:hypothetical protein
MNDFVTLVWTAKSDSSPRDGGIFCIERLVNDGIRKTAIMRLRRYVLVSDIEGLPSFVETVTRSGERNICATADVGLIAPPFFSAIKKIKVAVDAGSGPSGCPYRLLRDHYADVEIDPKTRDVMQIKYLDAPVILPNGESFENYLKRNFYTAPPPGGLFRHEPGFVDGETKATTIKPPGDCNYGSSGRTKSDAPKKRAPPKKRVTPKMVDKPTVLTKPTKDVENVGMLDRDEDSADRPTKKKKKHTKEVDEGVHKSKKSKYCEDADVVERSKKKKHKKRHDEKKDNNDGDNDEGIGDKHRHHGKKRPRQVASDGAEAQSEQLAKRGRAVAPIDLLRQHIEKIPPGTNPTIIEARDIYNAAIAILTLSPTV